MPSNVVPTDQPSIFSALTALGPNQALVTADIPSIGIAGFLFDIPDEDRVELASDITDYHIEDNTSVQDNIAIKPIKVTLRGFTAELVSNPDPEAPPISSYPDALPLNEPMVPTLSPQAAQTQDDTTTAQSNTVAATQSQGQNLYQIYQANQNAPTRQSAAFGYFFQLWIGRVISISVETPWGVLNNMAIENLVAIQSKESKFVTDFIVTFKQIRTTSTTIVGGQLANRAQAQADASNPTPNGTVGTYPLTDQQMGQFLQGIGYTPTFSAP